MTLIFQLCLTSSFAIRAFAVLAGGIVLALCWVFLRSTSSPLAAFPGPDPQDWIFGNLLEVFESEHGAPHERWAEKYGHVFVYQCLFGEKRLSTIDAKALNHILLEKAELYPRTPSDLRELDHSLGHGIASAQGEPHRRQKKMLLPFFSPTQLKEASPMFEEKSQQLCSILRQMLEDNDSSSKNDKNMIVDMYAWFNRVTLDIIGQAGFGHSFNSLLGEDHVTRALNRLFCSGAFQYTGITFLIRTAVREFTFLQKFIRTQRTKAMKEALRILTEQGWKIYEARHSEVTSGLEKDKKDLITLLIRENSKTTSGDKLREDEIMSQISTFIAAGSETTATSLSWATWLMTRYPEVQVKLRNELLNALEKCPTGSLEPEMIYSLPYLDAFCREVLRFIPPATSMLRQAISSDQIPLSTPVTLRNGDIVNSIPIQKGQTILIPISAYNRSKSVFGPTADQFDPERWMSKNSEREGDSGVSISGQAVGLWAGLLSFGTGPKSCIGYKFSVMEMKVILAHLLLEFKFEERDPGGGPLIERRANSVVRPRIAGKKNGAEMPLRISFWKQ
ncbi:cytochrome P450 monooxygenase [Melampsora larici-populina 98AG31]|uniref:Cytochrome P450 monooxygenase n=1 Tax=Melampsora larici-populina (strain 98AG31 / pathotype 3-4-7) TaxID=747676 RepID=F4S879_MELLP|nr:cytochrome P450 monooxygenase [Melampsora larici-populina 98AG31]EGF99140.1 cytochrome P450 monooxygenase [Melampsora larici-populina 98AG31]